MRPRGMPPTPNAASRANEPVGITGMSAVWLSPNRIMAPLPYCFSIWLRAKPRARCFSSFLLLTVGCAIISPTAHAHASCWLIADGSVVTLVPRPSPDGGGRECLIIRKVLRAQRCHRVVLQDHLQRLCHCPYPTEFHAHHVWCQLPIGLWQETAPKSELSGLTEARFHLPDSPHLTGETHLTKYHQMRVQHHLPEARRYCHHDPEINRWLLDIQSTNDVDIHIIGLQRQTQTLFQHCQ